ncbi:transcriptional regulator MraZ [Lysobacter pythonis]|uniref:Transcriptional regulator MraZ n=1 Tax=Solilutibacter pythonis TaxID=2483112 RepID=A0A3M2I218_9GAMM|nr:division/cell wall cluster transcriptional repressor MraZ [Lysobacter pythonis]RMH94203.1 transcriptional regulator MraZ [Lysobacter pythonis]
MFQGETAITIDDKGRLTIPTAHREQVAAACANQLVITYNPFESGCLFVYPRAEWERVRDEVNALPSALSAHRRMQRMLVGSAVPVEPDANGRIGIPASHRGAVGIEKKAVLLGMGGKFELWSEQAHYAQIRQVVGDDDLSPQMMELRL